MRCRVGEERIVEPVVFLPVAANRRDDLRLARLGDVVRRLFKGRVEARTMFA
jgi:hypothetical protein